jgi:hypothetical protein
MTRFARLAAAVLPLLGLAALWVESDLTYNSGTEWEVPIMGYDPRDYLRGHYVEFEYDWPGLEERSLTRQPDGLCLAGQAPRIARVTVQQPGEACAHPLRPAESGVYGLDGLRDGRLYIGQARAAQLEEQLRNRDQRGIVTIRQREDGSFTPITIHFRPLTPEEIAERDAPGQAPLSPFDPLAPPAVMDK